MRTINVYCTRCKQSIHNGHTFFQLSEKRESEVVLLGDLCGQCVADICNDWCEKEAENGTD